MNTISISTEEWQGAYDAVTAADPSETDTRHGVALIVSGGQRTWYAWSDDIAVMTAAFDADGDPDVVIPVSRRLVSFALPLSQLDDVNLTLDATHATVSADGNSLRLDHPGAVAVPQPRWGDEPATTARLSAHSLHGLLTHGGVLPAGVDPNEIEEPAFNVSITPTGLVAEVDWDPVGVPATRLEMAADTFGSASRSMWFAGARRLLAITAPEADIEVVMPASNDHVLIRSEQWIAAIPTLASNSTSTDDRARSRSDDYEQLTLFDPDYADTLPVAGAYPVGFVDPFEGRSLTDLRALAIDPDPDVRIAAASSRWNWDVRLQRVLATDPDERVVLALLDRVDPYVDVCELIIAGPHVEARRQLAGRNLRSELLERLADDADRTTRETATAELARRTDRVVELEGTAR